MEKKVQLSMLCEIYGSLLTKKQLNVLNDYCNEDLSISEIAENNNTTRQAINDIVKKGESKLLEYESGLGIMKKTMKQEKQIQMILAELGKIKRQAVGPAQNAAQLRFQLGGGHGVQPALQGDGQVLAVHGLVDGHFNSPRSFC